MRILKNYLYNLTYQIMTIIFPIISTPYISRVLKAEGVGQFSVSTAVVQYFALFGMLGISMYGSRQIAYVRDDIEILRRTFWELNILRFITMSIMILIYCLYLVFYVPWENKLLYSMHIFTLLGCLTDISWFFAGTEDFKKIAIRNVIVKLVSVILIFFLVNKQKDVWIFILINTGSLFIGQLIMWKDIHNNYRFVRPSVNNVLIHLKGTIHFWILSMVISVYTSLDKVMLGFLANNLEAGLYENSQKIIKIITTITSTLALVTLPRIANMFKNKLIDQFNDLVSKSFSLVSFVSFPMAFGIIAIRKTIVPWFFGPGYEEISNLLIINSGLVIILSWANIFCNQILLPKNKEKKFTVAVTIGAIVNIGINGLLMKKLGATAAAIASLLAEGIGMLVQMFFVRKDINLKQLLMGTIRYFISSVIMCFVVYYIGFLFESKILAIIIQIISGLCIYMSIMFAIRDINIMLISNYSNDIFLKLRNRHH